MWVQSLVGEDALEGAWQPTPVFLSRESHRQRCPTGRTESDTTEVTQHGIHRQPSPDPQRSLTPAPAGSWAPTHQPPCPLFVCTLSAFLPRETLLPTVLSSHREAFPSQPSRPAEPPPRSLPGSGWGRAVRISAEAGEAAPRQAPCARVSSVLSSHPQRRRRTQCWER